MSHPTALPAKATPTRAEVTPSHPIQINPAQALTDRLAGKASWELAKEHDADDLPSSEGRKEGQEEKVALEEVQMTREEGEELVGGLAEV